MDFLHGIFWVFLPRILSVREFGLYDDSMIIDWMLSAAVMIKDFSEIAFRVYEMTSLLLIRRVAMMHIIKKNHLNIERTMNILSCS